jgi:hypothetical protein
MPPVLIVVWLQLQATAQLKAFAIEVMQLTGVDKMLRCTRSAGD